MLRGSGDWSQGLFKWLAWFLVVLVLAGYLANNKLDQFGDAMMPKIAADFAEKLNLARTQWILAGKPDTWRSHGRLLRFNQQGYPANLSDDGEVDCRSVLYALLGEHADQINTITAVERSVRGMLPVCRYYGAQDAFFDYFYTDGRIVFTRDLNNSDQFK